MHSMPITVWGGPAEAPCLLDSFARTVASQPSQTALVDEDHRLSYAELYRWSARIADQLIHNGVTAGDRVAVLGPRGAPVIAAMLATISIGAAYVPLDQEYPRRRLEHMIADSRAVRVLVAGDGELDVATNWLSIPEWTVEVPQADHNPFRCAPEVPVYVIYTSGSTGWPKGVAVPHSCVDNMVAWQAAHSPAPDLRTAQFAPLNFDVCFQEVLGTLCGGGTLLVVPERLRRDPFELLDWLGEHRVERLFLPYLALQMMALAAEALDTLDNLALVEVNTAGEQLVCTPQIRAFFDRLPGTRLCNHYGQSESAMVTSHILAPPAGQWPALPPIGVPLPGCELLVDPDDPADPTVGELLVAGRPVSLGYLDQPALNAERYVTFPPTAHGHTRGFRTRDLVRLDGGTLHYLGRMDDEVKVRGVRVNLHEIDACLLDQPVVAEAASVLTDVGAGSRGLRAAIVPAAGCGVDEAGLLRALGERLPAVSVPLSITEFVALPRTPNGKIDRGAIVEQIERTVRSGEHEG